MGFPAKGVLKSCPQKEEGRPEPTCKPNKQEACSPLRLFSRESPLAVASPAELPCAQGSDVINATAPYMWKSQTMGHRPITSASLKDLFKKINK